MPRRPRIQLIESDASTSLDPRGVFLFSGRADENLDDDLREPPLRSQALKRILAYDWQQEEGLWTFTPRRHLPPASSLVFALSAWARPAKQRQGLPWTQGLGTAAEGGGATLIASWPAEGSSGVPRNLPALTLIADGDLELHDDDLLFQERGEPPLPLRLNAQGCNEALPEARRCWSAELGAPLEGDRVYVLSLKESARDATGAPLQPWSLRFRSAPVASNSPPRVVALACESDERSVEGLCIAADDQGLSLRVQVERAAEIRAQAAGSRDAVYTVDGRASLRLSALPPGSLIPWRIDVVDLAGQLRRIEGRTFTESALLPLSIHAVQSDPAGPDPDQEYVELHNFGHEALALTGCVLAVQGTPRGEVIEESFWLAPGGRVRLVSPHFDPHEVNAPLPPGVALLRMKGPLGKGGLPKGGVQLYLRDPQGRRLSGAPALAGPEEGGCILRRGADLRAMRLRDFESAAAEACMALEAGSQASVR